MANLNEELGQEIGWDGEISKESQFILLPEGEYNFKVESFERQRFNGSEKMAPCNMAVLNLAVTDPKTGETASVRDRLYLNSKAEWKLSQFFICLGLKKKGEPLRMNWNKVPGAVGKLELSIHKYKDNDGNDHESNQVKRYIEPDGKPVFKAGTF